MKQKNLGTPTTNRGVQNTYTSKFRGFSKIDNQYILIDWIQCTLMNYDKPVYSLFKDLFGLSPLHIVVEPYHLFGYDTSYSFKNIRILVAEYREKEGLSSMGTHLYITGSGCRDIEDLGISYFDLFKKLINLGAKFTRLDVSIDSFDDKYYTMEKVVSCIRNGEVRTKFKNSIEFNKTYLKDSSNNGLTIWFGSRASEIQFVFYDKLKERESQNYIVSNDIKYWTRLECRFRDSYALEVANSFVNDNDFNNFLKGVIVYYLDFVDFNATDSNKSRWLRKSWWNDFIDNVSKIKLQRVNVEKSISKSRRWLNDSVSHTQFMCFLSDIENISCDCISSKFIYSLLKNGSLKITDRDLQFINEYRLSNGLVPLDLSSVQDMIRDIKDVILEKV